MKDKNNIENLSLSMRERGLKLPYHPAAKTYFASTSLGSWPGK
jgi:hypothetical protein